MEAFMVFMTMKHNFYNLGIACVVGILIVYRLNGLAFIITVAATIALNDASSHYILKEGFARLRPCHVLPDLEMTLRCSNSFSFPSNHASNTFAAATLLSLCFRNTTLLAFALALLVGYSRVYLKVHYPFDILGGALYGSLIGYLCYRHIYKRISNFIKP
jgi:undecaprenyl-diphosphatase